MNSLFVLHDNPRMGIPYLADIHLRPTLLTASKIFCSAIHKVSPTGEFTQQKSIDGVKQYMYKGFVLLPPYPTENPWVSWACSNRYHFWWIVETMWWADKELTHRFGVPQSIMYLRMNKIMEDGCAKLFPQPEVKWVGKWPNPPQRQINVGSDDPVEHHRTYYKSIQSAGKLRMKWTARDKPEFMITTVKDLKILCSACEAPAPATAGCGSSACPFAIN